MTRYAAYDAIADQYASFVREHFADETSSFALGTKTLLKTLGETSGLDVCDLACGEGHLTTLLAQSAQSVIGVDLSARLIALAKDRSASENVMFVVDDAQMLTTQADESFDRVICNLALMDIPDLKAVYESVYRVLRPSGHFVFSITHPCFQAPHSNAQVDDEGRFVSRQISTYTHERLWHSDNPNGIRGQVGAFHRTLSTYLNLAIDAGFTLVRLDEPTLPPGSYAQPQAAAQVEIPSVMVMRLKK